MELANTLIAILALALSAVALYYSRVQHRDTEEIRITGEILSVIKVLRRCKNIAMEMKRERNKTGATLDQGEIDLFQKFEAFEAETDCLEECLLEALHNRKLLSDKDITTSALVIQAYAEGLTQLPESIHRRFHRLNQDKLPELKESIDRINAKFDELRPTIETIGNRSRK